MTALATVPPESLVVIARVQATAARLATIVDVLPLDTPEADGKARELLRVVDTLTKEAEEERKRIKAPHLERGQEIDRAFKAPRDALERVSGVIRRRLSEAAVAREQARAAAMRAVSEATREGDAETANSAALALAPDPVFSEVAAGVSDRMTWEARSFDIRAMPIEFLTVDVTRIRDAIKAADRAGTEPTIPGVTFERVAAFRVSRL